jgi:hypothetical protein
MQVKRDKPKIYERNPDTGIVRWRYVSETAHDYCWPHYGNILEKKKDGNE